MCSFLTESRSLLKVFLYVANANLKNLQLNILMTDDVLHRLSEYTSYHYTYKWEYKEQMAACWTVITESITYSTKYKACGLNLWLSGKSRLCEMTDYRCCILYLLLKERLIKSAIHHLHFTLWSNWWVQMLLLYRGTCMSLNFDIGVFVSHAQCATDSILQSTSTKQSVKLMENKTYPPVLSK